MFDAKAAHRAVGAGEYVAKKNWLQISSATTLKSAFTSSAAAIIAATTPVANATFDPRAEVCQSTRVPKD